MREGLISQAQFNKALSIQNETMRSIGRILVDLDLITDSMRMTILKKEFGFELIQLDDTEVEPTVITLIPYSFAEKHRVVPLRTEDQGVLVVAMEDPSDLLVIDAIKNQVGMRPKPYVASHDDIQHVLDQYQEITGEQPVL